jgi:sporulation protein YlmC with PRC-barrel domain
MTTAYPEVRGTDVRATREVRVEELLGKRVRDPSGAHIGRIEELIAEVQGTEMVVVEVHLGSGALLERLAEFAGGIPPFGFLRRAIGKDYRVPWQQLDLRDPAHPRVTVRRAELERIEP